MRYASLLGIGDQNSVSQKNTAGTGEFAVALQGEPDHKTVFKVGYVSGRASIQGLTPNIRRVVIVGGV